MPDVSDFVGLAQFFKSRTIKYPIPYAMSANLVLALMSLLGATRVEGSLEWVLVGFAVAGFLVGNGLFVYAMLFDTALLRSERYQSFERVLRLVGDSDDRSDIVELTQAMLSDDGVKKDAARSESPKGVSHGK